MVCVDALFDIAQFDVSEFDSICHADILYPTNLDTTTSEIYKSIQSTTGIQIPSISIQGIQIGKVISSEVNKSTPGTSSDKKSKVSIKE